MTKIVITGATGQLGQSIQELSAAYPSLQLFPFGSRELDITNKKQIEEVIASVAPDFIINAAAYTAVDQAEKDPEGAFKINAQGAIWLAETAVKHNAHLLHISTDYVFDGKQCFPYQETDTVRPLSVYGQTKLQGEEGIHRIATEAITIRTSWLYSPFRKNFVKTIASLARQRETLQVVFDQIGTPTYALDLANCILTIIEESSRKSSFWKPGIYHFSNEGVASWYDLAFQITHLLNLPTQVQPVRSTQFPTPAPRPSYSVLDKEKIKKTFSLTIPHWTESLEKCLKNPVFLD